MRNHIKKYLGLLCTVLASVHYNCWASESLTEDDGFVIVSTAHENQFQNKCKTLNKNFNADQHTLVVSSINNWGLLKKPDAITDDCDDDDFVLVPSTYDGGPIVNLSDTQEHLSRTVESFDPKIWTIIAFYLGWESKIYQVSRLAFAAVTFYSVNDLVLKAKNYNPALNRPANKYSWGETILFKSPQYKHFKPFPSHDWCIKTERVNGLPQWYWESLKGTRIEDVDLFYEHIGDAGVAKLLQILPNTQVNRLDLSHNNITGRAIQHLRQHIKDTQIRELNLGHNNFDARDTIDLIQALSYSKITTLILSGNKIGGDGLLAIGQALKNTGINKLCLLSNRIGNNGAWDLAQSLHETSVEIIDLKYNGITDAGAWYLALALMRTHVYSVDLKGNHISQACEKQLRANFKNIAFMFDSDIRGMKSTNLRPRHNVQHLGYSLDIGLNFIDFY